ncbi:FAD-dependent monooxygenase [Caballeronia sp. LZ035]|uniref:FAD-dependent monooxygenase n=1 Tax=Caballeronia sp. LZ035 TaxID=3038568 RepID=UPI00285F8E78|nr:FAD-dependent monooxygenase [Caballeronia sp. LZ035]MDR5758959.1 FAD-dependent monooxygenase [Caballeronia sp. LZ035]
MTISVLIVGAGPVGMTLASELARYGIPVRIVDKAPHRTDKSKAMVLWSRTLELLDRGVGGAQPFVDAGFKLEGVTFIANDRVVGRVAMDSIPSLHNYALALPQSETERLLEERLISQGISVERGVEATMIVPDDSGADAVLVHPDARKETVRADWLIGCDGAHSTVRHAMSVPFAGETLLSDWFLADVHMSGYPRSDTDASIHWHKDGVLLIFPIQPGRYRVIGDLPPTESSIPPTPTLDQVQELVDRRGPAGTRLNAPIWLSGFRINGRKVASYRQNHMFLAGDAAHIHSPAGGQGMNTGMQDAMNLGWKLALVMKGDADESLLDSYSPERSSVGDAVLKAAERLTAVATIRNPVAQQLRNLAAHFALGFTHFSRGVAEQMSEVEIHYPDSPLNGPHHGGARPGQRVPPVEGRPPVGSGTRPVFVLFGTQNSGVEHLVNRFPGLLDANIQPPLHPDTLSLVRPDGYLACSSQGIAEIEAYLGRVSGSSRIDNRAS